MQIAIFFFFSIAKTLISNRNIITTKFQTTFKMSTYLAAWAIVPNDWKSAERFSGKDNKPVSTKKLFLKLELK